MTSYIGTRTHQGCKVLKGTEAGSEPVDLRLDLVNHSPTGYAELAVMPS
jgi:hypothetical protein